MQRSNTIESTSSMHLHAIHRKSDYRSATEAYLETMVDARRDKHAAAIKIRADEEKEGLKTTDAAKKPVWRRRLSNWIEKLSPAQEYFLLLGLTTTVTATAAIAEGTIVSLPTGLYRIIILGNIAIVGWVAIAAIGMLRNSKTTGDKGSKNAEEEKSKGSIPKMIVEGIKKLDQADASVIGVGLFSSLASAAVLLSNVLPVAADLALNLVAFGGFCAVIAANLYKSFRLITKESLFTPEKS